ncbi:MAG: hypothetical protein M3141_09570 [Actinomycetota bacterium]|nr:hypothetical protein [Actinomycetota bacterium]
MTQTFIIALAAETYVGVLLLSYRREAAGLLVHYLRACSCPSWRRCERFHKHAR